MKEENFYAIYSKHQNVVVFTQNYKKFKRQFFKLTKNIDLTPTGRNCLRSYLLIKDYYSVNKILSGIYFVTEYQSDEVYENVMKKCQKVR